MGVAWMAWVNDPLWGGRFHVLLQAARDLRDDHHAAAIVAAQTACEVCTEVVLTETFRSRDIEYLSDPLDRLLPNYNLGNDRVRRVYEAVARDRITTHASWPRFKQHTEKRNAVVHRGEPATRADADASIATVEEIIDHLLQHYYDTWHSS